MTQRISATDLPRGSTIPSLDGIRAIAVSLVFLAHSGLEHVIPGGLGVTIFFVLSGYLISTLLRIEYAGSPTLDLRAFYLRRLLRLMPPLFIITSVVGLIAAAGLVDGSFSVAGLAAVLLYFGNYFVIATDFAAVPAGIAVVWSLAVEEHFYLVYPPLAAILLRIGRAGVSAATLLGLCLLVLAWRCWLVAHGAPEDHLTMATDTRVDAILFGCLLAVWKNPWLDHPPAANSRRDGLLVAAAIATLLFTLLYRDAWFRMTLRYSLQSMAIVVFIYLAVGRSNHWSLRWLNARVMTYLGAISYTVYLSHHVVLLAIEKHWPQWNWMTATAVAMVVTLAIAEPMRRWVEDPCARLRRRLHKRATPAPAAVSYPVSPNTTTGAL
jgi:peptidoglycan/LPS O-acetylase OafA/YrhL